MTPCEQRLQSLHCLSSNQSLFKRKIWWCLGLSDDVKHLSLLAHDVS